MTYKEYRRNIHLSEILDKPLNNVCCRVKLYCELIIENEVNMYFYIPDDDSICFDNNLVLRKFSNIFLKSEDIKKVLKMEVVNKISKKDLKIYFSLINV